MKQIQIIDPEVPIFPQKLRELGYFYLGQIEFPHGDTPAHIAGMSSIDAWDVRRIVYSRFFDPKTIPTKTDKEEIKGLVKDIADTEKKRKKYTDEEAERIYNKQDIENVEGIRSLEEIKKGFELPRKKIDEQLQALERQLQDKFKSLNKRYLKEIKGINVEKVVRETFAPVMWLMLPQDQVERLVRLWNKMDVVTRQYLAEDTLGDELDFYGIA